MNYAIYPQTVLNITQSYNGTFNHYLYSTGVPADYPIDIAANTSLAPFYAPCKMKCVKIYGQVTGVYGVANGAWFTSTDPVNFPDGSTDYLTIKFVHMNNADFGSNGIKVGRIYEKYELVGHQGTSGQATGPHLHVTAGKGYMKGSGWVKNSRNQWVLQTTGGQFKPEQLLYVDKDFTPIIENTKGIIFKDMPIPAKNKWKIGQILYSKYETPIYFAPENVNPDSSSTGGVVKVWDYRAGTLHPYFISTTDFDGQNTPYQYGIGWVDEESLEEWNPPWHTGQICKYWGGDVHTHVNYGLETNDRWRPIKVVDIKDGLFPYLIYTINSTLQQQDKMGWVAQQTIGAYTLSDVIFCATYTLGEHGMSQDQIDLYDINGDGQVTLADVILIAKIVEEGAG